MIADSIMKYIYVLQEQDLDADLDQNFLFNYIVV